MYRLRIVPLTHWIIIIALVILSILSLTPRVEASTIDRPQQTEQPDAYVCGAWRTKQVSVWHSIFGSGQAGFSAGYRYNNCKAEGLWIQPLGYTTLSSISYTWVGFYRPPGSTSIHAGVNYTVCMTPVYGIGPCWTEYMRLSISRTGAREYWGSGSQWVFIQ